jgi:hypothetical protein
MIGDMLRKVRVGEFGIYLAHPPGPASLPTKRRAPPYGQEFFTGTGHPPLFHN